LFFFNELHHEYPETYILSDYTIKLIVMPLFSPRVAEKAKKDNNKK